MLDARKDLNSSEWGVAGREQEGEEAAEKVYDPMHYAENDRFPQPPYSWMHPKARLTQAERDQLAQGLTSTLGGGEDKGEGEGDENLGGVNQSKDAEEVEENEDDD